MSFSHCIYHGYNAIINKMKYYQRMENGLKVFILCCLETLLMFHKEVWITHVCGTHDPIWGFEDLKRALEEKKRKEKAIKDDRLKYWSMFFLVFVRNSYIVAPTFCPTWPDTELGLTYHRWQQSLSAQFRRMMWFWYVLAVLLGTTPHTPLNS